MSVPQFICVDWGTTRLRAFLVDEDGSVLDRISADAGIMSVPDGEFASVFRHHCGTWLDQWRHIPVVMAGMVGSRNGWVEAPYGTCPATLGDIADKLMHVSLGDGRVASVVPGLCVSQSGQAPDVMRGEETLAIGTGATHATIILPGTHSKWVRLNKGRIETFATFMTGELYATFLHHTILGKLSAEPSNRAGFARGLATSRHPGGLTHQAFAARTLVLMGEMSGQEVGPFLSGLLIGTEIDAGLAISDAANDIIIVADDSIGTAYSEALAVAGRTSRILSPEVCFVAGLSRILSALPATGA